MLLLMMMIMIYCLIVMNMVGEKKDVRVSQGLSPADGDGHHHPSLLAVHAQ
jgi:hypothetical protein